MSGPGAPPPPGFPPPGGSFPPPGQQSYAGPYPPPPPSYPPSYPSGWGPVAPPPWGAAHKPGAIPLRPLNLGDIYDGSFKIIRFNPRATVGSAVMVSAIAMAIPLVLTGGLVWLFDLSTLSGGELTELEMLEQIGTAGTLGVGAVLQWLGLILVTGMVAHVAAAAAVGRRMTLGEAWRATHGRRWRLVGLSVVIGFATMAVIAVYVGLWVLVIVAIGELWFTLLWGFVTVPLFICLMVWMYVRLFYLAVPSMMLERTGVFAAIGRGHALTRKQFWRTFGVALLTGIITGVASQMLSFPVALVGEFAMFAVGGATGVFLLLLAQSLGAILSSAFVAPFSASVTSLQYIDQRMRKEAYDVELMTQAGIITS